jgi:3'-phosphoadenosine 5'-phosphosulfate sulfotransferase (PAPS reductase)/FAD synthetase
VSADPLSPDLVTVCPGEVIADLTAAQREERVNRLVEQAHYIVDTAWDIHSEGRMRAAWCVLYSGGNDSTVLTHLMRSRVDYAVHANTTIGVEQTRQFVRDTCKRWELPLLERTAPVTYRELVIEQGFPGAGHHFKMFQRLKERALRQVRRELVTDPRRERVMFIAGRRRDESRRRVNIPLNERDGSTVWASPLAMWTKEDMGMYRAMCARDGDPVPFNSVSDALGMSGECLCGSFAKPGELERIRLWFPDVAAEIDALEVEVRAAGHPEKRCRWGHGTGKPTVKTGNLCTSCTITEEDNE